MPMAQVPTDPGSIMALLSKSVITGRGNAYATRVVAKVDLDSEVQPNARMLISGSKALRIFSVQSTCLVAKSGCDDHANQSMDIRMNKCAFVQSRY